MSTHLYFDKKFTNVLKGIALILMFVHHLFTFPSWYINGISYPYLNNFARIFNEPFKICVPIFAFLTGYTYVGRKRTLHYSLNKIITFLTSYWFVYAIMLIIYVLFNLDVPDFNTILYELLALKRPVMSFCWYVNFYCLSMLILPFFLEP